MVLLLIGHVWTAYSFVKLHAKLTQIFADLKKNTYYSVPIGCGKLWDWKNTVLGHAEKEMDQFLSESHLAFFYSFPICLMMGRIMF